MGNSTLHITKGFSKDLKYSELHCHTNYSFQEGASSPEEILIKAHELEISAVAITDHDNLCGAMEFAQVAKTIDIQAIIGVELTLNSGILEQSNRNDLSDKKKTSDTIGRKSHRIQKYIYFNILRSFAFRKKKLSRIEC